MDFLKNRTWWLSVLDRMGKSFIGGFMSYWLLATGVGNTPAEVPQEAIEAFFSMDNVYAGVLAVLASFGLNVASTRVGVDKNSPSITVTESPPTLPPAHG